MRRQSPNIRRNKKRDKEDTGEERKNKIKGISKRWVKKVLKREEKVINKEGIEKGRKRVIKKILRRDEKEE